MMKMMTPYRFISLGLLAILTACAGAGSGASLNESDAPPAQLTLVVKNESDFNPPKARYNTVDHFVITVTGAGLDGERTFTYPNDTTEAQITELPVGAVVDLTVEAINEDGVVFKRGYAENVAIDTAVQEAVLNIKQVPIFVNVTDHAAVRADRLHFKVFADPDHTLTLKAETNSGSDFSISAKSGSSRLSADRETGLLDIYPETIAAGAVTFILRDEDNRESTSLSLSIAKALPSTPLQMTSGAVLGSLRYQDETTSSHLVEALVEEDGSM